MAHIPVLRRYEQNPILTPAMVGPDCHAIHNSGIVRMENGGYRGVFRVDGTDLREHLHAGRSDDGLRWSVDPKPISVVSKNPEVPDVIRLGYDPRVTFLEGNYYVLYCLETNGSCISMLRSRDLQTFEHVGIVMHPYNRNAVLFPGKIGGKYLMLHRPGGSGFNPYGDIWCSESTDLIHWGRPRFVMAKGGGWGWTKIGPGPAPVEIDEGWLLFFHGVHGSAAGLVYSGGAAILDRDEPWKVRHRCTRYLISPTEIYERTGEVPNVVFPTSIVVDPKTGKYDLYYGCADTCIGLARGDLRETVEFIKANDIDYTKTHW